MRKFLAILLAICTIFCLCACQNSDNKNVSGVEDGVLTIAMECAYAPYNWTQYDNSNGAVPIKGSDNEFANGYDVLIAKKLCEENG